MASGMTVALLVRHEEVLILPRGCDMARTHRLPSWWSSSTTLADELKNMQRLGELPHPPATIRLVQPEPQLPYVRVCTAAGRIIPLKLQAIEQFTGLSITAICAAQALCAYHWSQTGITHRLRCVFVSDSHNRKGGTIYYWSGNATRDTPAYSVLPFHRQAPLSASPGLVGQHIGDWMAQEPETHTLLWLPQGPLPHMLHLPAFATQLQRRLGTAWHERLTMYFTPEPVLLGALLLD